MQNQVTGQRICLYNAVEMDAVLERMANQIAVLLNPSQPVMMIGILRRGAPIADRLFQKLQQHHPHSNISLMQLQIKRYADDLSLLHPETKLTETPEIDALDLSNTIVLLVDDVLYEGYSMLRAVEYLSKKHPAAIRTVVLVDRSANKLPIKADVAGLRLEIAPNDIIECNVPPYEAEFKIELCKPDRR